MDTHNRFKSRHSGEIEFVNTLADTLESFGWAVTQSGEISQVRTERPPSVPTRLWAHQICALWFGSSQPSCPFFTWQVRAYMDALLADSAALARTHLFFDVATATNFYEHPAWARLRCRVRVLDFFGTPTPGKSSPRFRENVARAALAGHRSAAGVHTPDRKNAGAASGGRRERRLRGPVAPPA